MSISSSLVQYPITITDPVISGSIETVYLENNIIISTGTDGVSSALQLLAPNQVVYSIPVTKYGVLWGTWATGSTDQTSGSTFFTSNSGVATGYVNLQVQV